jgi:hypothetical protein
MVAQDISGFSAHFQQEMGHTHVKIRITVQGKLFAVHPGVRVSHHVNQTATFQFQRSRDRFTGKFRDFHQEFISPFQPHRNIDGRSRLMPNGLDKLFGFFQLPGLQQQGINRIGRVFQFSLGRAAGI